MEFREFAPAYDSTGIDEELAGSANLVAILRFFRDFQIVMIDGVQLGVGKDGIRNARVNSKVFIPF